MFTDHGRAGSGVFPSFLKVILAIKRPTSAETGCLCLAYNRYQSAVFNVYSSSVCDDDDDDADASPGNVLGIWLPLCGRQQPRNFHPFAHTIDVL